MNPIKDRIGAVVGCLFGFPLLVIAAVTTPVWLPIFQLVQWRGERREIERMKKAGRFIEWGELMDLSEYGKNGTLIFEQAQKASLRLWWTKDDLKMVSPYAMPVEGDIDYFFGVDCPFMRWLRENYTGNRGKAFRTHLIVKHAPGFAKSSDFAFTGFRNIVPAVRWIWKRPFEGTLASLKDLEPNDESH